MKVLFLDVDGVLNHHGTFKEQKIVLCLDDKCLDRLVEITTAVPDVKIVLSSTWRRSREAKAVVTKALRNRGLRIFDSTPIKFSLHSRGAEIRLWMAYHQDENPDDEITHFAILDDDSDFDEAQQKHVVHTSMKAGLTDRHVDKAIKLLTHCILRCELDNARMQCKGCGRLVKQIMSAGSRRHEGR